MSSIGGPRPARATAPPVTLAQLAALVGVDAAPDAGSLAVTGVTHDSAAVRTGDLFAALPGARHHGAAFVPDAASRGAVAVLTDPVGAVAARAAELPALVLDEPRAALGLIAAEVYGRPAETLLVLGVTGTNGKTTTVHLLHSALSTAGRPAGLIGTIETRVGDDVFASARTTPEATDVQALLAVMLERGAYAVAMEASSIAVEMGRVDGLVFDVAGFTNLSQDHLDFHSDMEAYFEAKAALFTPERARVGVVVIDDDYGRRLAESATIPIVTASTEQLDADWRAVDVASVGGGGSSFTVLAPTGEAIAVHLALRGRFNVQNALLAVAMLVEAGFEVRAATDGVAACSGVPGRMESVALGQPFAAFVDYAHTPSAVAELVSDLRESGTGRVLLVLGCGGDRDAAKRPLMGEAGARGADVLVVTDDNPRSESPGVIRAAVLAGARAVPVADRADVREVADRAEAIRTAVDLAVAGDVVVIAGKGHEQGQEVNGVLTPFDDREQLRAALQGRAS